MTRALELRPQTAAYLDTLGEVWFARGDRERALKWSGKAVQHAPGVDTLLRQHERFRTAPIPVP